ncbi:protein kinase [Pyxidicoccus parkwayensis]|uniref:non-specific serine/threonine protein kinase n=1 Tax=Pyxidicoccus parkwayensis TaxID=2813578 RepID=A0ABX7NUJ6_9BACT|nr:protein kinase [Pyxidicoccus parkwaysis]QSQ21175.1 protein kinase [Pyxidicoccus parkwaysis]
MAHSADTPTAPSGILFTRGDTAYEFFFDRGKGRHGERLLVARPRTPEGLQAQVVLKCVSLPEGGEATGEYQHARMRLEEEVRLARYLQHPGIARVHDLFEMKHGLCVVMESVEGLTLDTLLAVAQARGRYFSESFVLYVGAETAAALAYAHTLTDDAGVPLGIVNRDINPARIRVGPRGQVRLTDFGVALSHLAGRLATSLPRLHGEVLYSAPEALLGDGVDARTDLFSLGLTLLEFANGRHLYDPADVRIEDVEKRLTRKQREQVLEASVTAMGAEPPPFAEDAILCAMSYRVRDVERATQGLSATLRDILHTLLRRKPEERFATASELEAVLRARLAQLGTYRGADAVKEVQEAMLEAGDTLDELDVPDDEGGITPLVMNTRHPDELVTAEALQPGSSRHPWDFTTKPGSGLS